MIDDDEPTPLTPTVIEASSVASHATVMDTPSHPWKPEDRPDLKEQLVNKGPKDMTYAERMVMQPMTEAEILEQHPEFAYQDSQPLSPQHVKLGTLEVTSEEIEEKEKEREILVAETEKELEDSNATPEEPVSKANVNSHNIPDDLADVKEVP